MRFLPFIFLLIFLQAQMAAQNISSGSTNKELAFIHLKGKINNKYAFTMDLPLGGVGYYYYDADKFPAELDAIFEDKDSFNFSAFHQEDGLEERFIGHFDGMKMTGIRTQSRLENNNDTPISVMPFYLIPDTSDIVQLHSLDYSDSLEMRLGAKKCIQSAYFDYSFLLPNNEKYADLTTCICFAGAEVNSVDQLSRKMKNDVDDYFEDFKDEINTHYLDENGEPLSEVEKEHFCENGGCVGCYRVHSTYSEVTFNSSKVFSFTITNYELGGSRCCRDSKYYSYSLIDHHLISLQNIFSAHDSLMLKGLLLKHLMKFNWETYSQIDVTKFSIPEDYYFTTTGIVFIYKGWADEPIFIPFSKFGNAVKKQSWME